jgi:hypothetical protein
MSVVSGIMGANSAEDAAETAADAQTESTDKSLALQREQFEYQKELNKPFYDKGLSSFDQMTSAINGTPMANGKTWTPTESPAYKWQQQQMEKNTGRSLRAMGRYNSTYGMNAVTEGNKNLAASEYDKQLGRLADMTNIARGGASTLANASSGFANNAGNSLVNMGNNQANAALAGGVMRQNSLNNMSQGLYSGANLAIKAYGNSNNNGALYNDAGGDINNVDFGSDW